MNKSNPKTIHLKDYTPTPYLIERVDLDASLKAQETQISSRLSIVPNPRSDARQAPLELDGEAIRLTGIRLNGGELAEELRHRQRIRRGVPRAQDPG